MTDMSIRAPLILGLAAITALLAGFGVWSVTATLSGAVIAEGQVEVERNRQIVQHPEGGVVTEILVREGDRVTAGAVLLRLDGAALRSELAIVDGQLTGLAAETARLLAERDGVETPVYPHDLVARARHDATIAAQIDGQSRLFHARHASVAEASAQLNRRIDQLHALTDGISAQIAAFRRQSDLIAEDLATQQSLHDKGLTPASSLLALRREAARLDGQLGELAAARARTQGQITEIELQISSLTTRRIEEATAGLRDIGPALLEHAERQRALQDRIARLDLTAPVDGIVLNLQVTTPRAVLRPADPVLYLVPQDWPLVISAEIAPVDVDAVHVGQSVELVVSAFTGRDVPHLFGKVAVVSADALADTATGVSFYRVEILLDPGQAERLGRRGLLPGMPVSVFVQTGARTPLAYLLQPFAAYFSRAFRES